MLTTADALQAVLEAMPSFESTGVDTGSSVGRILRQAVVAERDQPPFDRVMMDGIAIRHDDFDNGRTEFPIQAMQAAGDAALDLADGCCIEIMTGASLPQGADCIVPVERLSVDSGAASLEPGYHPQQRQFIHARASDHAAGATLLEPGKKITAADIAVISSAGLTSVDVSAQPTVRIISTGNELVPAGQSIEPHQIRLSNGPAIQALLDQHGYVDNAHDHLVDERETLLRRIGQHLDEADVIVLSGGVSMGKADFVPGVLAELGVDVIFHKVSQRPGKPLWFGKGPRDQVVFALPGNPVSALVCCRYYVIPALESASARLPRLPEFASLASEIVFAPELTCFQPVRLISNAAGQVLAMPVKTNTSGDFTALSATDGFVELAREESHFPAGSPVFLHRWYAG